MQLASRTAFHPLPHHESHHLHLLEQECNRLIAQKEPLEIVFPEDPSSPLPLRLLLAYTAALAERTLPPHSALPPSLKQPLFRLIATALERRLFRCEGQQKVMEEVSYSLAFKPALLPFWLSVVSQNTNHVLLERLAGFLQCLASEQFLLYLPLQLYFLLGGSLFTIESRCFKQKLVGLVEAVAKVLSQSETFISRNAQHYRASRDRKFLLDESLKVVVMARNKEALAETTSRLCTAIFRGKDYLTKEEFLQAAQALPVEPVLTILPLLLRSQLSLLGERSFLYEVSSRDEAGKANFYSHELTKLLNKCPFNGDERCNCKKCQCVRRNRESAKANQQKKRNAVEQVDQMRRRIEELEHDQTISHRKITQLEEENLMLKTLLKEIKLNHTMKSSLLETLEPLSKVLDNEL